MPEFGKDCKRLGKKYLSLPDDLELFKKVLEEVPLGTDKHFALLFQNTELKIAKARFFCRFLKKNTLRIIYAYHFSKRQIVFIELYFKGDQNREDKRRIGDYIKQHSA